MNPPQGAATPHRDAGPLPRWLAVTAAPPPDDTSVIDGRACRTRSGLFAEFARALRFPDHFGHNWDALADCLRDVAGGPGPTVSVGHAEDLLTDAPELTAILLEVLGAIAVDTTPGVAVTLHVPGADLGRCTAATAVLLPDGSPA
ncbi:barstar family protein [Catellatospora paridis]|uniref:barstar family protein n=1 Tax=Catellatospora paridis TaxID=1617086 RepID=UPI001E38B10B|nr:barstar family protein [Catellatospora paridis]